MDRETRRIKILELLKNSEKPISGASLAKNLNVSRQIIVQDISVLKAANYPIMSTAQGYLLLQSRRDEVARKVVAVSHNPEDTENELNILINSGVTIVDVRVEHPVYGEVSGKLLLKTKEDVEKFLERLNLTQAKLISELTNGIHLHTLESENPFNIIDAEKALKKAGYLIE